MRGAFPPVRYEFLGVELQASVYGCFTSREASFIPTAYETVGSGAGLDVVPLKPRLSSKEI
jgi:hypothetical protein